MPVKSIEVPEVLACAVPSVIADVSEIAGLPATPSPLEMESGALTVIVRLVNVSAAVWTTRPSRRVERGQRRQRRVERLQADAERRGVNLSAALVEHDPRV
jgi:hypothetical protein